MRRYSVLKGRGIASHFETRESAEKNAETGGEAEGERGDNLLITNYDRYHECGHNLVAAVRIQERYHYVAIEDGYSETVIVEGNRERLRGGVRQGLDYAREHGLRVQCNNPHVREDIESGILDAAGLLVVDSVQRTIVDGRDRRKGGVDHNDWNL